MTTRRFFIMWGALDPWQVYHVRLPLLQALRPSSVPHMFAVSEAKAEVFPKSPSLWWRGNSEQSLNLGTRVCLDPEYVKGLRHLTAYPQPLLEFYRFWASFTFPMRFSLVMQCVWGPWSLCSSWSLWGWNDSCPELIGWHNLQVKESETENLLWKTVGSQTRH